MASATAAKALAELQNTLPNIGGVVDFFTGGNAFETFANGLTPFGEGMKAYSDAVSSMNSEAAIASATAAFRHYQNCKRLCPIWVEFLISLLEEMT